MDAIVTMEVLEHIPPAELTKVIAQLCSVLDAGGTSLSRARPPISRSILNTTSILRWKPSYPMWMDGLNWWSICMFTVLVGHGDLSDGWLSIASSLRLQFVVGINNGPSGDSL